jgi:hypothetical protein
MDSDDEGGGFAAEYAAASASEEGEVRDGTMDVALEAETQSSGDHPFAVPSPIHTWEPRFQSEEEARDAIEKWAPDVVELIPVYGSYPGLVWNPEWLKKRSPRLRRHKDLLALEDVRSGF